MQHSLLFWRSSCTFAQNKESKNPTTFDEYRPITLLNTDFKLFSKVLANRIKEILPDIFVTGQTCGVQGKTIFHNLGAVKSALSFYEKNPHLQGALIGIDLKRAFDSISHKYLFNCLKHIGIPSMLIDTLHNIYQSSFSQVNINGFMTPRFHIQRGVRQGCPLSMHLFTLVMETLVRAVNRAVSGLKVQNVTLVCRAYADDIFILLSNPIQFDPLLSAFETFQAACGTSINWSKSSYLPLGTWVTPLPPLTQVSQIKILGIQFHQKMCTSVQINWSKATNRIHTLSIQCLSRRLS